MYKGDKVGSGSRKGLWREGLSDGQRGGGGGGGWEGEGGVGLQALPCLVATQGQFQRLVLQVQVELQTCKMFLQGL